MERKRSFRYVRPGDLSGLERRLNAMSRSGWQAVRPGRFVQSFARSEGCFVHRFDFCPDRPGSAGEITLHAANERAGWSLVAQRGGWRLYRKPEAEAKEQEQLPDGRTRIGVLFRRRIERLETLRRWMLVLGSILLMGGYAVDQLPVLYSTALPMTVALFVSYRIQFMEEGIRE